MIQKGPERWLLAAQVLFVAGGAIAYTTATSFALWTAVALVAALAGVWQVRATLVGAKANWMDRAASAAAGTWAVLAILILMPYIAIDGEVSLWAEPMYQALLFSVATLGMMLWSVAAFQAIADESHLGQGRTYALFHVVAWAVGLWLIFNGDGGIVQFQARGGEWDAIDLAMAPLVGAIPGLVWFAALLRR